MVSPEDRIREDEPHKCTDHQHREGSILICQKYQRSDGQPETDMKDLPGDFTHPEKSWLHLQ